MADLIERYVYDVVRRLPEKDREDVQRELNANIYDMLGDEGPHDDEAVKAVLNSLGAPAVLAGQYRQNPRYLISPAVYDDYIRALKWVVPLVGGILLALGAMLGAVETLRDGMAGVADIAAFVSNILSQGLSMGVSGAFQALVWTTLGFVIAERTGAKIQPAADWTVDQLPEEIPSAKGRIPLSDSIVELIFVAIFTVLAVLFCTGMLPFIYTLQPRGDLAVIQPFAESFLAALVPALIIGGVLSVAESIVKIVRRRWTPLVCGTVVASNLVGIGLMLWLFTRPQILSPEFTSFLQSQEWGRLDIFRWMGTSVSLGSAVLILIAAIVVIASLAECGVAIYRTIRASRPAN